MNDGSCVPRRVEYANPVWSYDFVAERTHDGRPVRILTMVNEYTREWLERLEVQTLFIEPGSPWENGYVESFIGKLRDELLNGEILYALREGEVVIGEWRRFYNQKRLHSSLGYRPPAPEAIAPIPRLAVLA